MSQWAAREVRLAALRTFASGFIGSKSDTNTQVDFEPIEIRDLRVWCPPGHHGARVRASAPSFLLQEERWR